MPSVPAHLRECASGLLQGGMRTADVASATNCEMPKTVLQGDRTDSWSSLQWQTTAQDRYIQKSHLQDRYRMATTTAQVTPGMHNPSISAQTVRNRLREVRLRACRPVVSQVLTRHHWHQRRLWAQAHHRVIRQDWQEVLFTDESWVCLTRGDGRIRVYRGKHGRYTQARYVEPD